MKYLNEIETYISNGNLVDALATLQIFAKSNNNYEVEKWCEYELSGYPSNDANIIPEYRKIDHKDLLISFSKDEISFKSFKIQELTKMAKTNDAAARDRVIKLTDYLSSNKTCIGYGLNKIHVLLNDLSIPEVKLSRIMKDIAINHNGVEFQPNFAQLIINENSKVIEILKKDIERKIIYHARDIHNTSELKSQVITDSKYKSYFIKIKKFGYFFALTALSFVAFVSDFQQANWDWLKILFFYNG